MPVESRPSTWPKLAPINAPPLHGSVEGLRDWINSVGPAVARSVLFFSWLRRVEWWRRWRRREKDNN